ncbi:flagellar biosynthesis protein FliZ [Planococcus salinus]|uniref:Flagellar biosynthesis protein FliZ n=2 Tax=Planococcus salinus TaxID=1848460 RepID=A0A3M8P558_9BACL|nr:flagellar biosynthesis protein FliZ [Planococcus salinus]
MAILLLCAVSAFAAPSVSAAADTKVSDWLNDGQDGQPTTEETEENGEAAVMEEKSMAGILGQLVFYTLLIVVLIYGLIKFLAVRQTKMHPNQAVQLVGGTSLGNNKSLQLVKVGNKMLLIGVGDQVTLIKEFAEGDEVVVSDAEANQQTVRVADAITGLVNKVKGVPAESKTGNGFEQLFKQSLNKQKVKQQQLKQELADDDDQEGRSS